MIYNKIKFVCLTLKSRKDRRYCISKLFPKEIYDRLEFFYAKEFSKAPCWFYGRVSAYSQFINMIEILNDFILSDYEYLLYLEDDVVLSKDFEEELENCLDGRWLPNSWHMCFLGGNDSRPPVIINEKISKCVNTFDIECTLFNKQGAKVALEKLSTFRYLVTDRCLAEYMEKDLNAYKTNNRVAGQCDFTHDNSFAKKDGNLSYRSLPSLFSSNDSHCVYAFLKDAKEVFISDDIDEETKIMISSYCKLSDKPCFYNIVKDISYLDPDLVSKGSKTLSLERYDSDIFTLEFTTEGIPFSKIYIYKK